MNEGKPGGLAVKTLTAKPEFDHKDLLDGRPEPTLERCPQTSTSAPWHS